MNKETFRRSVERWTGIRERSPVEIGGLRGKYYASQDMESTRRYAQLYNLADKKFAPILAVIGTLHDKEFKLEGIIFDLPKISDKQQKQYDREVQLSFDEGKPWPPFFVDINYWPTKEAPLFGFRLLEKGDGKILVKVINAPGFYLSDTQALDYGAIDPKDGNDMNILLARISDYFEARAAVS